MLENRILTLIVVLLVMELPVKGAEKTEKGEEKQPWLISSVTHLLPGLLSSLPNSFASNGWPHRPSCEELESIKQGWLNAAEEIKAQEKKFLSIYNALLETMSTSLGIKEWSAFIPKLILLMQIASLINAEEQ